MLISVLGGVVNHAVITCILSDNREPPAQQSQQRLLKWWLLGLVLYGVRVCTFIYFSGDSFSALVCSCSSSFVRNNSFPQPVAFPLAISTRASLSSASDSSCTTSRSRRLASCWGRACAALSCNLLVPLTVPACSVGWVGGGFDGAAVILCVRAGGSSAALSNWLAG